MKMTPPTSAPEAGAPAFALQGSRVLILGLGDSGLAMARWCARQGAAEIRVWDSRESPPQAAALLADVPGASRLSGELPAAALAGAGLVLKSPGLAPADPRIAPLLAAARAQGARVAGELDLFAHALASLRAERGYAPKLLAITGTNGKTTTTALTALLVKRAGLRTAMAGNIGPSLLDTLSAALDAESAATARTVAATADADADASTALPEVWVLELSSFQLDGVQGFEPTAAAVLNLTQDHLDWHGDMASYGEAKSRIFGKRGLMVINRDDARVEAMAPLPVAEPVAALSGSASPAARARAKASKDLLPPTSPVCRFGLDQPRHLGDYGLIVENGMAWLVRAVAGEAQEVKPSANGARGEGRSRTPAGVEVALQRLMPADALRIRGRHNAANALAALALASAAGCPLASLLHGLREYRGEPHRVEPIGQVAGIEAYDDSKGTNVGATVAAIEGLGADRLSSKLVLILGGDGKGQDFSPLAAPVARHVRAVATLGRDAPALEAALADTGVPLQRHATLESAVPWCFAVAQPGDAVLLSPACASLDMFRNYAHRAEVFVAAVQALAAERGEVLA